MPEPAGRLRGKVAIVTGGAAGIGRASAKLLAREGAAVAIGDINQDGGQATVADIECAGGRGLFVQTDVPSVSDARRILDQTVERFGGLHVLHNNAYWAPPVTTVLTLAEADWDHTLDVCLKGMYLMSRFAIPAMLASGGGSIVNMASAVALLGSRGNPAYVAAKGAVISFTRALAIDFGKQGIRANCVAPGSIATEANAERRRDGQWAAIGALIGVLSGLAAGYAGGGVDALIMRLSDVLFSFPGVLLGIGLVTVMGPALLTTALALAIAQTPYYARVMRGVVLTVRDQEFVLAARSSGARGARIALRHVLPNCSTALLVQESLSLGFNVLAEVGLSFIGLGVQPPAASWGNMLSEGQRFVDGAPWLALWPGLAIALLVFALNSLADALRDALDPNQARI